PVRTKGKYHQKIRDTEIEGSEWALTHWKALHANYKRAAHYEEIAALLEPLYLGESYDHISQLNRRFIDVICAFLRIETVITNSWDYILPNGKTERLTDLCHQAGGVEYVSGPSARSYIEENIF